MKYRLLGMLLLCGAVWHGDTAWAHDCFDRLMSGNLDMGDCANSLWDQVGPVLSALATIAIVVAATVAAISIGGPIAVMFGVAMMAASAYDAYERGGVSGVVDEMTPLNDIYELTFNRDNYSVLGRLGLMAHAAMTTLALIPGFAALGSLGRGLSGVVRGGRGLAAAMEAESLLASGARGLEQGGIWPALGRRRPPQIVEPPPPSTRTNTFMQWYEAQQEAAAARRAAEEARQAMLARARAQARFWQEARRAADETSIGVRDRIRDLQRPISEVASEFGQNYNFNRFSARTSPLTGGGTPAQINSNGCWNATMRGMLRDMGYPEMTERQVYNIARRAGLVNADGTCSVDRYGRLLNALSREVQGPMVAGRRLPPTELRDLRRLMDANPDDTVSISILRPGGNVNHRVRLEGYVDRPDGIHYVVGDPGNGYSWEIAHSELMSVYNADRTFVISATRGAP